MRLRNFIIITTAFLLVAAGLAWGGTAGPFNTSGSFRGGDTFTLTASGTNTATYTGADASAPANTVYDTATTGTIIIGSGDVTNVSIDSDAGLTFVENDDSIINSADSTFDFTIDEAGPAIITCSDTDAQCPLTVTAAGTGNLILTTDGAATVTLGDAVTTTLAIINNGAMTVGAAATTDSLALESAGTITLEATGAITVGDASATAITLGTDGVGDAEVVLPENSIGPDEIAGLLTMNVTLCGELAENATTFFGPHITDHWLDANDSVTDSSIGGTLCDGLDNTTEGSADAPLPGLLGYKVLGMYCKFDGTLASAETLVFSVRSATADLTADVTCSIAEAETSCISVTGSTTDIASGATIAVEAVMVSNNSDDNAWCRVVIAPKAGAV